MTWPITWDDVVAARGRLATYLAPTPLCHYPALDAEVGRGIRVLVKHDNHLPTNAFKARNALAFMTALEPAQRTHGVVAATRGNHGAGLAWAGAQLGVPVVICVPHGNNPEKNAAMRGFGAEVIEAGRDYDENTASAVHKKCRFCLDLHFSESLLCPLNRNVQANDNFICHAFRQKLINVNKPTTEKAGIEISPADSFRAEKIKELLDSDKSKYRNALAVQRLQRDPDEIYLELKYHFAWNVLGRRAVFEKSADYFDFISDLFLTCGDLVGGYAQLLWMEPDHVHIYVVTDGRDTVEKVIRKLKQHSGKAIIDHFPEMAKKLNPKNRLWDKAYFSETSG